MPARVLQVNVSQGGAPKLAVHEAHVGREGLSGDSVNHPKIHGGPERAVCLFSLDLIHALQDEGHPIFPGAVGENLTISGLDWSTLDPEAVLAIGDQVRLQLTKRVDPCNQIADAFAERKFKRIDPDRVPDQTRWYARVLTEGTVRPGDAVRLEGVPEAV